MRKSTRRRGALPFEMAITVPILLLFLFASLEFCSMNNMRHSVDNAAYEAARRGIVPGATSADVVNEANTIMSYLGAQNVSVTIMPDPFDDDTPELTVSVSIPVDGNGWVAPYFFGGGNTLVGQCRLLREEY